MHKYILFVFVALATFFVSIITAKADNKQFVVVLDAGHGGKDPGAVGSKPTNREKDINLAITLAVGNLLKQNCSDVKVLYTRDTDVFVELGQRAHIANKAKADLFVSIHTNALPKEARQARGVQSYTLSLKTAGTNLEVEKRENSVIQFEQNGAQKYSFSNPKSSESDIMFELMQDRDMQESIVFAQLAQDEMVKTGGRNNMGVFQANLAVLRLTYMPSVLLEVGYISTPSEEEFLMSKNGQTTMAKSIYNAISRYKTQKTGRLSALERVGNNSSTQQTSPAPAKDNKQAKNKNKDKNAPDATPAPAKNESNNANKPSDSDASKPVFKIQVMTSPKQLVQGSSQFKGLECESFKEGGLVKYTYGNTTDYNEILRIKKNISKQFPDAFVVSFKNGVKIDNQTAINEWKQQNGK